MPIQLGNPTTSASGPWNDYVLIIFWILQLATTAWFQVTLAIMVLVMTVMEGNVSIFLFGHTTFVANLVVIGCVIHEWRLVRREALTSTLYYRFQAAKSAYYLAILALAFVPSLKSGDIFGMIFRFTSFVAPFWGALWYAYVVRKNDVGFEGEGIRAWW